VFNFGDILYCNFHFCFAAKTSLDKLKQL